MKRAPTPIRALLPEQPLYVGASIQLPNRFPQGDVPPATMEDIPEQANSQHRIERLTSPLLGQLKGGFPTCRSRRIHAPSIPRSPIRPSSGVLAEA